MDVAEVAEQVAEQVEEQVEERIEERVGGCVVLGVQGRADLDRPLRWAAREASLQGRRLVALHVDPDGAPGQHSWVSPAQEAAERARRWLPSLDVRAVALDGRVRDTLLEVARHAHLLVLGSRGRGVLRSIVLGSVSSAVTSRAEGPVVVVRPGPEHGADAGVVVSVDSDPGSLPVTEFAFQHASRHGRPLTVMHCYVDAALAADLRHHPAPSDAEELASQLSQCVAGMGEKYPDVDVTTRLVAGPVDACLTRGPERHQLLVIGRDTVDRGLRMVTGSMATAVLQSAHTAVAVVPEVPAVPAVPAVHHQLIGGPS